MKSSISYLALVLSALACAIGASSVRADGGAIICSKTHGNVRITVFASPSPLSVGLADFSVLLQSTSNASVDDTASIRVMAFPKRSPDLRIGGPATREAATNKLMQAISIELTEPGEWVLEVGIGEDSTAVQNEFFVNPPIPSWFVLGLWIVWPFPVICIFAWRQLRSGNKSID